MPLSKEIKEILEEHVHRLIRDHPRTNDKGPFGYKRAFIREWVIRYGLANFSNPMHKYRLSADDRVLLYCECNMPMHLQDNIIILKKRNSYIKQEISKLFKKNTTVLDFGCGPATACLALADQFRNKKFYYYGIDKAEPMLNKAKLIWDAAVESSLIDNTSKAEFFCDWENINQTEIEGNVLLVFSYFFASMSLGIDRLRSLTQFINSIKENANGRVTLLYVNSPKPFAREKYNKFRDLMGIEALPKKNTKREYQLINLNPEFSPEEEVEEVAIEPTGNDSIDLLSADLNNETVRLRQAVKDFTNAKIDGDKAKKKMEEAKVTIVDHIVKVAVEDGAETAYNAGDLTIKVNKPRVPSKAKAKKVDEFLGLDKCFPVQSKEVKLHWSSLTPELQDLCKPLIELMDQAGSGDEESKKRLKNIKAKLEAMPKQNDDRDQIDPKVIDWVDVRALKPAIDARSYFQLIADLSETDRTEFISSVGLSINFTLNIP
jgi:SAM-dependent methyltransferase